MCGLVSAYRRVLGGYIAYQSSIFEKHPFNYSVKNTLGQGTLGGGQGAVRGYRKAQGDD